MSSLAAWKRGAAKMIANKWVDEGGHAGAAEVGVLQSPSWLQPWSQGSEMMPRGTVETQLALPSVRKTHRPRGVACSDGAHGGVPGRHVPQTCAPHLRGLWGRHRMSGGGSTRLSPPTPAFPPLPGICAHPLSVLPDRSYDD